MSTDKFKAHFDTNWVCAFNDSLGPMLQELTEVVSKAPEPRYLCSADQVIPGLPMIPANANQEFFNYRRYLETPWGWAKKSVFPYYEYHFLSYFGGLYQLVSDPVLPQEKSYAALPAATIPELGYAALDVITGAVTVYTGNHDNGADIATLTPVWDGQIPTHSLRCHSEQREVMRDIRQGLQRQNIAVYPTDLLVKVSPSQYPWYKGGLPSPTARIANHEVSVAIVGYALNDDKQLVYVSLIGHKTACRSIWGSLSTSHRRVLTLDVPGRDFRVTSAHNYACFSQPLGDNGQYRLTIVHKNAFAAPAVDESYCITPWIDDDATDCAFATRLDALLPIGIKLEWGKCLRQAGLQQGLVECCFAGGDVLHAYRLKEDGWLDLVNDLLQAGELAF